MEAARRTLSWDFSKLVLVDYLVLFLLAVKKKKNGGGRSGDFHGSPVIKNLPANAGKTGLIPGQGRSHTPRGS